MPWPISGTRYIIGVRFGAQLAAGMQCTLYVNDLRAYVLRASFGPVAS